MKRKQRKDAQETRQRLLAAAAEVFAEKGFWETTHVEICEKAKANTAAVNYHFGSKENLYVEAWKYSFERSVEAHPPEGGVARGAGSKRGCTAGSWRFMRRIADPNNHEIEIMHKEMANPTGLLAEALQRAIEPMRQGTTIVQELLGDGASEQQISFCEMSLMGQCFGPMLHLRQPRWRRGLHIRRDRLSNLASRSWPITSRNSAWRGFRRFARKPGRDEEPAQNSAKRRCLETGAIMNVVRATWAGSVLWPCEILAVLMLAGCTVGPNYVAPETATPQTWHSRPAGWPGGRRDRPRRIGLVVDRAQ